MRFIAAPLLLCCLIAGCNGGLDPDDMSFQTLSVLLSQGYERSMRGDSSLVQFVYMATRRGGYADKQASGSEDDIPHPTVNGQGPTTVSQYSTSITFNWLSPPTAPFLLAPGLPNVVDVSASPMVDRYHLEVPTPSLDADIVFPKAGDSIRISSHMEIVLGRPLAPDEYGWVEILGDTETPAVYENRETHLTLVLPDSAFRYRLVFDDLYKHDFHQYVFGPTHLRFLRVKRGDLHDTISYVSSSFVDIEVVFVP